jgi:hypothetical protein
VAIHISEDRLKSFAASEYTVKAANEGSLARSLLARSQASKRIGVFLSHSHEDKDLVLPAVRFLQSQGVDIFVDWLDQAMPTDISGETARILKQKIVEYSKFLMLVTENSKNSKWVPWELGVADGHKSLNSIALLAVDRRDRQFTGNEYLNLYPKIEWYNEQWLVWLNQSDGQSIFKYLPNWLRQ